MAQKKTLLTIESLAELASVHQPPCLSLYQPTHRRHPENRRDPVRFRNLVKALETSLRQEYPAAESRLLLEPFEALAHDHDFWNHSLDGVAVLGGLGLFRVFQLQRPVAELTVVADSFHTKPLRRSLQSVDRYHVLGLSLHNIRLFEGDRDLLEEINPGSGIPQTITEALGDELTEPHLTVASYGGVGEMSTPMRHGHGGRKDRANIDAERFFRVIDRAVLKHHSRPSGLPLILAALPEHHHLFRQVSRNPFLMAKGLAINPDALPAEELRELAWQVVEPQYQTRLAALADEFAVAKSNGLGSDDLAQVAQAAAAVPASRWQAQPLPEAFSARRFPQAGPAARGPGPWSRDTASSVEQVPDRVPRGRGSNPTHLPQRSGTAHRHSPPCSGGDRPGR